MSSTETPWAIRYGDHTWTGDDLTAGEAIDIAIVAGGGWAALDPYGHPGALAAIVAVLRSSRLGEPLESALGSVRSMPAADLMGCLVDATAEVVTAGAPSH